MPAETHQRSGPATLGDVLSLLSSELGVPDHDESHDRSLDELDCCDDLALLDLWETAVEEHAERTVMEVDLDELRQARTLRDLARCVVDSCSPPAVDDGGGEWW